MKNTISFKLTKRICFFLLILSFSTQAQQPIDYVGLVNPMIGTGGHGHTYPGVCLPFGMVQLSPDTRLEGWDGCSAYHYSDSIIYGFSHTHLSGTGCPDYGDILLMPARGKISLKNYDYSAAFSHKNEKAKIGGYGVALSNGIQVELTATPRCGYHKYMFPAKAESQVVLNLAHRDEVIDSYIILENDSTISGLRRSKAWAEDQYVYFYMVFSKPFHKAQRLEKEGLQSLPMGQKIGSKQLISLFSFGNIGEIFVKVGISAVSEEGAKKNLLFEISGRSFQQVRDAAQNSWRSALSKIEIEGGTQEQQSIFYTALYHCMLTPNLYSDVDGSFRGRDLKIHKAVGFDYYTVFSLWDTYRAEHPLFSIIEPERTVDFIQTMLSQYETGGILPVWELAANETNCMIGYHSVSVITDAYIKGIRNFDAQKALEAMKKSADADKRGLLPYRQFGYIPYDIESESVSKTLEYAYDDWCIAQFAKTIGKKSDYENYIQRAQYYKNVFDPGTGFFRAKANGKWFAPFLPNEVNFNYTEANAWQYSLSVPQDIQGLTSLLGGPSKLEKKLDELFSTASETSGRNQADITGMIGQYAHGNEPSHHMAYLYNYANVPWRTQSMIRKILTEEYHAEPDGLCGNEDCGQMSAWYVMSAMGLYAVTPGSPIYNLSTPLFDKITLHLENGKQFVVSAPNASKNQYISSVILNSKSWNSPFITHEQIANGGKLEFQLSVLPDKNWGLGNDISNPSAIHDHLINIVPYLSSGEKVFTDSTLIAFGSVGANNRVYYTTYPNVPDTNASLYQKPFYIYNSTSLQYVAYNSSTGYSKLGTSTFNKIPAGRKIKLLSKYANQYSAGGDEALIDNIVGANDFRTGAWQGYEGVDLNAVVDLGKTTEVHSVSLGCLQEMGSWIFMPESVLISFSDDNVNFKQIAEIKNDISKQSSETQIKSFGVSSLQLKTRYIKVVAKNSGPCPAWHPGAGNKSWIFADEICIK